MSGLVRPLWFLDIDGVVNALRPRDGLSATKARTSGETWPIHWSVEVVQLINTVHRSGLAEVRWLTTWEQDAHLSLAPAVGLDPFPSYDIPLGSPRHGWWKADVVADVIGAERRPFVWTDDDLAVEDVAEMIDRLGVDHLLVAPDPHMGLSSANLRSVVDFISQFAPERPSGKAS